MVTSNDIDLESQVAEFLEKWHMGNSDIIGRFIGGYCWHFAHMLKCTFRRGTVCLAAPFSHFIWVDEDGTPWDAEGKYVGEAYYFIPENELPERELVTFRHVPGENSCGLSVDEAISLMKEHCLKHDIAYDDSVKDFLVHWQTDNNN